MIKKKLKYANNWISCYWTTGWIERVRIRPWPHWRPSSRSKSWNLRYLP